MPLPGALNAGVCAGGIWRSSVCCPVGHAAASVGPLRLVRRSKLPCCCHAESPEAELWTLGLDSSLGPGLQTVAEAALTCGGQHALETAAAAALSAAAQAHPRSAEAAGHLTTQKKLTYSLC